MTTQTLTENLQIYYDQKGRPASVVLPFDLLARWLTKEKKEKLVSSVKKPQSIYNVSDKEIVAAVDEVRSKLWNKYYADKIKTVKGPS